MANVKLQNRSGSYSTFENVDSVILPTAEGGQVTFVSNSGNITIEPLSVSANGTYTAPSGKAYSPVVVNVSGGGSGEIITRNSTAILPNNQRILMPLQTTDISQFDALSVSTQLIVPTGETIKSIITAMNLMGSAGDGSTISYYGQSVSFDNVNVTYTTESVTNGTLVKATLNLQQTLRQALVTMCQNATWGYIGSSIGLIVVSQVN